MATSDSQVLARLALELVEGDRLDEALVTLSAAMAAHRAGR